MPDKIAFEAYLEDAVDLNMLIDRLDFSEEDVSRCVLEQASLFLKASRYRVQKMQARVQAETYLERMRSEVSLRLREKKRAAKRGEGMTESAIKDRVNLFPKVIVAQKRFNRAAVAEELARLLVDAYRQRKDALRLHIELAQSEIAGELRVMARGRDRKKLERLRRDVGSRWLRGEDDGEPLGGIRT